MGFHLANWFALMAFEPIQLSELLIGTVYQAAMDLQRNYCYVVRA